MMMNTESNINTKYGTLYGIEGAEYYIDGQLCSTLVAMRSPLTINGIEMIPNFSPPDVRKKYREAVSFYEDGTIRSIYLEKPVCITTKAGEVEAELITFYPNGAIRRIFPLYGQLSAYWGEEDERKLAKEFTFQVGGRSITCTPQCIHFYLDGQLRSITIWRQDIMEIDTIYGAIPTRVGVEFYVSGHIRSIEPPYGTVVQTEKGPWRNMKWKPAKFHADNNALVLPDES